MVIIITIIITIIIFKGFNTLKLATTKGERYYTQKCLWLRLDCACVIESSVSASGESTGPGGLG